VLAILWRRLDVFVLVLASVATADLVAFALKRAIDVDRPPVLYASPKALVRVPQDASFPSGHSATSFAAATVIAAFAPRLAIPAFVLAGAIAFSRVYNGVHWPIDVIAGAALGVLVATALLRLVRGRTR
jgi:undecaprenyl-diphosphatase